MGKNKYVWKKLVKNVIFEQKAMSLQLNVNEVYVIVYPHCQFPVNRRRVLSPYALLAVRDP